MPSHRGLFPFLIITRNLFHLGKFLSMTITASSTEGNPAVHQNANYFSLRTDRFQLIFLHISLSNLHPRPVCWTVLNTQVKQQNWNRKTELQVSFLMTRKTARVQKYIRVRKIKGESTTKGKYEKYSNLQKFPCPAVIKAARTGVLSFLHPL